jgi:large subunit ribosomal protein L24
MKAAAKIRQRVNIRKGDLVRVMKGRDRDTFRDKTSRVLSVDPVKMVVTVEHAHLIKRHTRPNPSKNIKGGIVEREGPIHISNVRLVCPGCHKPTRIGHSILADGSKVRTCRRCGATLEK